MNTLNGYKEVQLTRADGTTFVGRAKQLTLREYKRGFELSDEEIQLVGYMTETVSPDGTVVTKLGEGVLDLSQASYDQLRAATMELNTSFFEYCDRERLKLTTFMKQVDPALLKVAAERISKDTPQGLRPRAE